ncbi:hypothetical protein C0989_000798, partial [Termitomyces sp. Mn162]
MEDRRVRKELQDNFGKLLDSNVMFVGRSYDQGSWIRRTTKESLTNNGRNSPIPVQDYKNEERQDVNTLVLSDPAKSGDSTELISK